MDKKKEVNNGLEQYKNEFLIVPKINDRKPVFISVEQQDRIDELVHRLGGRKMSVSGFIENLVIHHFQSYQEELEVWKRI